MAINSVEGPFRIDPLTNENGQRILDSLNRPQAVLKVIDAEALPKALATIKLALEASRHPDVDDAINRKMQQFSGRVYSEGFAQTIQSLNDALRRAQAGQIDAFATVLGITSITPEGRKRVEQSLNDTMSISVAEMQVKERATAAGITQGERPGSGPSTRVGSISQATRNLGVLNGNRAAVIDAATNGAINPR